MKPYWHGSDRVQNYLPNIKYSNWTERTIKLRAKTVFMDCIFGMWPDAISRSRQYPIKFVNAVIADIEQQGLKNRRDRF